MKKRCKTLLAITLVAVMVAGCGEHVKEEIGAVVGAGVGALAGSYIGSGGGQLVAVAVGTLLGSIAGSEVGKSLDRADRLAMAHAQQEALENGRSGDTMTWENPDSGNSGDVVPQPAYRQADGTYCREFSQTVTVGGKMQSAYGTACRQPDGTWKII